MKNMKGMYKREKALIKKSFNFFVKDQVMGLASFLVAFEIVKDKAPTSVTKKGNTIQVDLESQLKQVGFSFPDDICYKGLMPVEAEIAKAIARDYGIDPPHYYFIVGLKEKVVFKQKKHNIIGLWTLTYGPASPGYAVAITPAFQGYCIDTDGTFPGYVSLGM